MTITSLGDQFLRVAKVTAFNKLGLTRDFTGLRVRFNVSKTSESNANSGRIQILNLNPESRSFLEGDDMRIQLEAGYPGATEILCTGNVTKAVSVRQPPDWVTTVESGDGVKALREKHLDISFGEGTPYQAILSQALRSLGVTQGPTLFAVPDIAVGGFSFSGTSKELIDKLARRFGLEWSIQNGAVQMSSAGVPVPGLAIVISGTAGLIGNVIKRDKSIEFTNLINGEIVPGKTLSVITDDLKGLYKCRKVDFDGDSHDGPWFAKVEAVPL